MPIPRDTCFPIVIVAIIVLVIAAAIGPGPSSAEEPVPTVPAGSVVNMPVVIKQATPAPTAGPSPTPPMTPGVPVDLMITNYECGGCIIDIVGARVCTRQLDIVNPYPCWMRNVTLFVLGAGAQGGIDEISISDIAPYAETTYWDQTAWCYGSEAYTAQGYPDCP